jgi:hypothetical protein
MINIQSTPNAPGVEAVPARAVTGCGPVGAASGVFARTTMATLLIVAAILALAVTSLADSERAQSNVPVQIALVQTLTIPASVPRHSGEVKPLAFGHVEMDWDPAAPGGIPGFDIWPPGSQR